MSLLGVVRGTAWHWRWAGKELLEAVLETSAFLAAACCHLLKRLQVLPCSKCSCLL